MKSRADHWRTKRDPEQLSKDVLMGRLLGFMLYFVNLPRLTSTHEKYERHTIFHGF